MSTDSWATLGLVGRGAVFLGFLRLPPLHPGGAKGTIFLQIHLFLVVFLCPKELLLIENEPNSSTKASSLFSNTVTHRGISKKGFQRLQRTHLDPCSQELNLVWKFHSSDYITGLERWAT